MSDLWGAVGVLDLLDILVVAFLIYRLLVVVRGTRALQVLGGLLVLAGLYGVSRALELSTVNWILEKFSFYLVLAVIILFQEDIRRALARFGNPLIGAGKRREQLSTYESVARACFRLADQGCGALIAVERTAGLDEYEADAALVDGVLSEEILVAIFQKDSPVHDGAVLLRNDRVWLAGVFLPLSVRGGIDPRYGTRHRAAFGLTEQTDSFVFVVSEERRTVSIAFRAELHHVESPDELRLKVQELLSMEEVEVTAPTGFSQPSHTPASVAPVPPLRPDLGVPPEIASEGPAESGGFTPERVLDAESDVRGPLMSADLSSAPPLTDSILADDVPVVALPGDSE